MVFAFAVAGAIARVSSKSTTGATPKPLVLFSASFAVASRALSKGEDGRCTSFVFGSTSGSNGSGTRCDGASIASSVAVVTVNVHSAETSSRLTVGVRLSSASKNGASPMRIFSSFAAVASRSTRVSPGNA